MTRTEGKQFKMACLENEIKRLKELICPHILKYGRLCDDPVQEKVIRREDGGITYHSGDNTDDHARTCKCELCEYIGCIGVNAFNGD